MGAKTVEINPRVHVFLLAFLGTDLTEDIENLERVFRDNYGYHVCTYWICGSRAFSRLDNVLLSFMASVEHYTDKIVFYYGTEPKAR